MHTAQKKGMYTVGHIPFQVGLDGVLAEGMDEIAHVEELLWEFVNLDRNQTMPANEWMPYAIRMAYAHYKPLFGLDRAAIAPKIAPEMSIVVDKLASAGIPICTTLFLDDLIVQKLFHPQSFLRNNLECTLFVHLQSFFQNFFDIQK